MDEIRSAQPLFVSPSFETIAAVDQHAALPHYRPSNESGKQLITSESIFLLDSGGQYRFVIAPVLICYIISKEADGSVKHVS